MRKDTVFHQIMKPITAKLIDNCKKRFQSDYHCKSFDTLTHLKAMIYAQINHVSSLRTLEVALSEQRLGIKKRIKRLTCPGIFIPD